MPAVTASARLFRNRRVRGSVIIFVLVTILLASFLLTKFIERAGTELLADARAGDQARLRREAYSALEASLAVIADVRAIEQGLQSPAQGWDRPLERAEYVPPAGLTVAVAVQDESGKLSLPRTDHDGLVALLLTLGAEQDNAEKIADALLVWTQPDYVPASLDADGSAYERATLPHQPARRPLRSFDELAAIETVREFFFDESGQPTALAQGFIANVSLYSYARINLNGATPAAMVAAGLDPTQIDALANYARQQAGAGGPGYFRGMNEVNTVLGANADVGKFGTEVSAVRLVVTVRSGATTYRLEAVVAPPRGATLAAGTTSAPGAGETASGSTAAQAETAVPIIKKLDYPFKVLEIREDVESPTATTPATASHD
jgi:general secretion pathway protein K